MSFDNSWVLGFLFLLVVLIPVIIIRHRKGREGAALFASSAPPQERKPLLRELRLRMIFSDIFFLLFIGLLIVALAGPRWGVRIVADHRRGVDVVLAFDLSRSMDVADINVADINVADIYVRDCPLDENKSRLDRALEIALELSSNLGDVRIGTAIGRGRGVLAVPLTHDMETIFAFLHGLNSQSVTGRGTNLESIIDAASAAFDDYFPSRRLIILFSDGEELSGSFQAAVDRSRQARIALSAVGLGSESGGPVPVERGPNAPDGFLLRPDGSMVISTRHANTLRIGAERTGGIYIDGSRPDAARVLSEYVNSLSAESWLSGHRREANPRWQLFILAAMACLAGARIMGFSRRNRRRQSAVRNFMTVFLFLILFSSCTRTQGMLLIMEANFYYARGFYTEAISSFLRALDFEEAAPYAEFGLGAVYFTLEESAAALERYLAAQRALRPGHHPELAFRIQYNKGIIFFERGNYNEAARAFREALLIDGSRLEAKRNLELSILSITRSSSAQIYPPQGDETAETGGRSAVLFDYLRTKEQQQWRSKEWAGECGLYGLDY